MDMKHVHRLAALLLGACLALCLAAPVGAVSASARLETIQALGIMTGDENGNMNLSASVTRAEFVKMMVAASPYKDSVGDGYGASLFKDVKSGHWASGYIKLAVEQEWVTGYVDGTFRPDNTITLEEGCTALLQGEKGWWAVCYLGQGEDARAIQARQDLWQARYDQWRAQRQADRTTATHALGMAIAL